MRDGSHAGLDLIVTPLMTFSWDLITLVPAVLATPPGSLHVHPFCLPAGRSVLRFPPSAFVIYLCRLLASGLRNSSVWCPFWSRLAAWVGLRSQSLTSPWPLVWPWSSVTAHHGLPSTEKIYYLSRMWHPNPQRLHLWVLAAAEQLCGPFQADHSAAAWQRVKAIFYWASKTHCFVPCLLFCFCKCCWMDATLHQL